MPRIKIEDNIVITYDHASREKYWTALSEFLINKHGRETCKEHCKVEPILVDGFNFLVNQFRDLILKENNFKFFLYVFWLHEESVKIYVKTLAGLKLEGIDESEFALYRRILKLIIEQGCDINLVWGEFPSGKEILVYDAKIQELIYLGTWMYGFADFIAFQKMVKNCHEIKYDEADSLIVDWQYHYGEVYHQLFTMLQNEYSNGVIDEQVMLEFKSKIESCFGINYNFASGQIFEIKKHHNPIVPELQTIEPHILPINLSEEFDINIEDAEKFYAGLTLSRINKLSIEDAILKPYSTNRYMFRPILIYNIQNENRALVGFEKFTESLMVLGTNAIQWNTISREWSELKCISSFIAKQGDEHDKILEDKIENIIKDLGLLYVRNIKSFKRVSKPNIRIDNQQAGEIDFIIVNILLKTVFVVEVKYNKAKYEAVGFRNDNTNFTKYYEPKLNKKVNWIKENLKIFQEHLTIKQNIKEVEILDYDVEGVFFINTPTFYMFNGEYKAITLVNTEEYLIGRYTCPLFRFINTINDKEVETTVQHPYFRMPVDY